MLPLLSSLLLLPLALGDQGAGQAPHHVSHHASTSHHAPHHTSHHAPTSNHAPTSHHALSGHQAQLSSSQYTAPYSQPAVSLPLESEGQEYTYPAQGQYTQVTHVRMVYF